MSPYEFTCSVQPHYLAERSDPAAGLWAFAYVVTIVNTGSVPAQLIARHWIITNANGQTEEVKGLGVVGQQPLLRPGDRHEYSSWTRLTTPTGTMRGSFFCVAEDGERFEAIVPAFDLTETRTLH